MLLYITQLSSEDRKKKEEKNPAGFTDGDTESEGSRVASIMSKKKMEALSAPKLSVDWVSASCPSSAFCPCVMYGGKME